MFGCAIASEYIMRQGIMARAMIEVHTHLMAASKQGGGGQRRNQSLFKGITPKSLRHPPRSHLLKNRTTFPNVTLETMPLGMDLRKTSKTQITVWCLALIVNLTYCRIIQKESQEGIV